MAIRYTIDPDKSGVLTVYWGEVANSDSVLYKIEPTRTYGENTYYLRTYPGYDIEYTVVPTKARPKDYLVYKGSSIMDGCPIVYYIENTSPYTIVREGDSIYNPEVYTVREGKAYRYIVEDRSFSGNGSTGNIGGAELDNGILGDIAMALADPKETLKFNLKHPLTAFVSAYLPREKREKMRQDALMKDLEKKAGKMAAKNAANHQINNVNTNPKTQPKNQSATVNHFNQGFQADSKPFVKDAAKETAPKAQDLQLSSAQAESDGKVLFICPTCNQKMKFPKNRGNITFSCPKCKTVHTLFTGNKL